MMDDLLCCKKVFEKRGFNRNLRAFFILSPIALKLKKGILLSSMSNIHNPQAAALPVQFKRNSFAVGLLKLIGWSVKFDGFPTRHGVLVVYPHTSNWDFCIGIMAKWALGIKLSYLAKDSLFKLPLLGLWMRHIGGRPVIRNSPQGYVADLSQEMKDSDYLWLVITPEGTRKKTPGWRSGFYRLALSAQVPIGLGFIDYGKKEVGVTQFLILTGQEDLDLQEIRRLYQDRVGYKPENMAPISFWRPSESESLPSRQHKA